MKTNYLKNVKLLVFILCLQFLSLEKSNAQYYAWATGSSVWRGNSGSFIGTDFHGNGIFLGSSHTCLVCTENYVKAISVNGVMVWHITEIAAMSMSALVMVSVTSDYSNNKYILFNNPMGDNHNFGSYSTNYNYFIVKYDSNEAPVRLTNLNEPYSKVVADSSGNLFIASASKVRRYTKAGSIAWTKTNMVVTDIHVDRYRNCYVSNSSGFYKFNPSGVLVYQKNVGGRLKVDLDGRVFVQNQTGLRKYSKTGVQQWLRPGIQYPFDINDNGNIYEFTSDSIRKYNNTGNVIQWTFEKLADGVVNHNGEIFIGGNYNVWSDDIKPCPFRLTMQPIMDPMTPDQAWQGLISNSTPIPFQAATYTNYISDSYSEVCSSSPISSFASPTLFSYCSNSVSTLDSGNTFIVQMSDINGSFNNPLNLGPPATAALPDSIAPGDDYQIRVIASTPGVTAHSNLPDEIDFGIAMTPIPGTLSVTGLVSICEGQTYPVSVNNASTASYIYWYNNNVPLYFPPLTSSITLDSTGNYFAVLASGYCFKNTDTLNLSVMPSPNPVISPTGPLYICAGDSIQLTVNDVDLSIIRWRRNGLTVAGAVDTTFYATLSGTYTSRVFNDSGCATVSDPVEVIVNCRQSSKVISNAIDIYPNPVSELLSIEGLYEFSGTTTLSLFDFKGNLVVEKNVVIDESGLLSINMNHLAPGVYMIRLTYNDIVYGKKMIVKD